MSKISTVCMGMLSILCLIARPLIANAADDRPFLASLFSDNMVLQRGIADPIWGWAHSGETITVRVTGNGIKPVSVKTVTDAEGKWLAKLPKLAVGGPYTLSVTGSGGESATRSNVLVGDVWICSGQSNMEFGMQFLNNPDQEIAKGDYPQIRLFKVDKQVALSAQETVHGTWKLCTPENLRNYGDWGGFSALGYFFGRNLYQDLKVPIGLIHMSWGGTVAQAWTGEDALLAKVPDFKDQLARVDAERKARTLAGRVTLAPEIDAWYQKNDPGVVGHWASGASKSDDWSSIKLPGAWEDSGHSDLAGFDGIVWFRYAVNIPPALAGKDLHLEFLADDVDTAWINGTLVGSTASFNLPRSYSVPASVLRPGTNVLTIRVLDTAGPGGIVGPTDQMVLKSADGQTIPLAGQWDYRIAVPLNRLPQYPAQIDNNPNVASVLYNGMVAPLTRYGIKGAIWYQGESNTNAAYQYRTLLPAMIDDWRQLWGQGDFPFLIVQLAGLGGIPAQPGESDWAELREAQWMTATHGKNVGIATAFDIGDPNDIHPKNKEEVARRLSLVARNIVYHQPVVSMGPVYRTMKIEGNTVRIVFDNTVGGLEVHGGGPIKGFALAGSDKVWHWADARIDGDTVVLTSTSVTNPIAVRYGWASYLDVNLYNRAGLPAFPFRTDSGSGVNVPHP